MTYPNATQDRIQWRCDSCGKPVDDGAGYLHVQLDEILARRTAAAERPGRARSLREVLDGPPPARWRVHHEACDPDREYGPDYWIDVERARTPRQLLWWTAHLLGKSWILHTDLSSILRLVGEAA